MLRDITLGQYYPAGSPIHRLDPRVKFVSTLLFLISLFLFHTFTGYLVATVFLAGVIIASRVPFRFMIKGMKMIAFLVIVTVVFNVLFTPGDILFQWGFLRITRQGLIQAARVGIRFIYLILGSSVMTLTTTPTQLTDGLERIMQPLKRIHVPVHEISMMMSIALRFIPILMEETDKIMKAQMARGADFESGNLIKKAKSLVPVLVPLFVSAFRRADDLAMAMEARCYHGGDGRTQMKPLVYQKRDYIAYAIVGTYFAISIVFRIWGI